MRRFAVLLGMMLALGFAPIPFRSVKPDPDPDAAAVRKGIGIKAASVCPSGLNRKHPKTKGGLRIL